MVCSNCALDLDPNATVCPRCGTTVASGLQMDTNQQVPLQDGYVNDLQNSGQPMVNGVDNSQMGMQGVVNPPSVSDNSAMPQGVVDIAQQPSVEVPNMQVGAVQSVSNVVAPVDPNAQIQQPMQNPVSPQGVASVAQQQPVVNPMGAVNQNMQAGAPANPAPTQNGVDPNVSQMVSNMRVDSVKPAEGMGKLNIIRKKSFLGAIIPFTVFVDGNMVGKLKNNTTLSFDLAFGEHEIILKSTGKDVEQLISLSRSEMFCDVNVAAKFGLIAAVPKITGVNYRNQ